MSRKDLEYYRIKAGFSRVQLAKKLNTQTKTVYEWEKGKYIPSFYNAVALAKNLKLPLKKLARLFGMTTRGIPKD